MMTRGKKPNLDPVTIKVVKSVLAMPPKPHDDMKVGRHSAKKKRGSKDRAASSKPPNA